MDTSGGNDHNHVEEVPEDILFSTGTVYRMSRKTIDRRGAHNTLDNHEGWLSQRNTFQQFHEYFRSSIEEFTTATAICGYISLAAIMTSIKVLSKLPDQRIRTAAQLASLETHLKNMPVQLSAIQEAMRFISESRSHYINTHVDDFYVKTDVNSQDDVKKDCSQKKSYMRDWVANYEISDFLRAKSKFTKNLLDGVIFLRFNQSSELSVAKHEERERIIAEEMQFLSSSGTNCGKGVNFGPSDTVFLVESFSPHRTLLTPEDFVARVHTEKVAPPSLFLLDLNGHFCIAVPTEIAGKKELTLFNSSEANYLSGSGGMVSAMAFDISFPPSTVLPKNKSCNKSSEVDKNGGDTNCGMKLVN